jgi:hypothetical protein
MKTFTIMIGAVPFDEVRAPDLASARLLAASRDYGVNPDSVWVRDPSPVRVPRFVASEAL